MPQFSFNQNYYVAAYERLSKEDDRKEESSSIESQKMIIESFAKFNNLKIIKHYSDDGFSGSNFNRPGFEELKRDIEDGMINCVIVKDLSRLGRELYLTGQYIEEYFLSKNVRFIAINDGYDSEIGDSMLGIRLSVNDMYLRDTSKKIRSSLDEKRRRGEYIATYAAYGYMKNPHNPKQLIKDPNVAWVVEKIFTWAASGQGTTTIAHRLNEMNIPIPAIYKKIKVKHMNSDLNKGNGIWRPQTIKMILENEIYSGHMVQGRWKKPSYNLKGCIEVKDKNKWFIVKNTHEAIIDEDIFNIVQKQLQANMRYRANKNNKRHLLQGLLYCKECGNKIGIQIKKKAKGNVRNIQCYTYSKYGRYGKCSSHYANYDELEAKLLSFMYQLNKTYFKGYNFQPLLSKCEQIINEDLFKLNNEIKSIEKQLAQENKLFKQLYLDKVNNILSEKQYILLNKDFEKNIEQLQVTYERLNNKLKQIKRHNQAITTQEIQQIIQAFLAYKIPSNELFSNIIDKIIIDKYKQVEIYFKVDIAKYLSLV